MLFPLLLGIAASTPLPDELSAMDAIRKVVLASKDPSTPWRLTRRSWSATYPQGAFGVGNQHGVDSTRFRFRIPPDADSKSIGGQPPFVVEAYENGLPSFGVRRGGEWGLCRPLGIEYGTDGECRNVRILVFDGKSWKERRLSALSKSRLLGWLCLNEARFPELYVKEPKNAWSSPWVRIESNGYGTYWLDHDLDVIGPFGIAGRLVPDLKESVASILDGEIDRLPKNGKER